LSPWACAAHAWRRLPRRCSSSSRWQADYLDQPSTTARALFRNMKETCVGMSERDGVLPRYVCLRALVVVGRQANARTLERTRCWKSCLHSSSLRSNERAWALGESSGLVALGVISPYEPGLSVHDFVPVTLQITEWSGRSRVLRGVMCTYGPSLRGPLQKPPRGCRRIFFLLRSLGPANTPDTPTGSGDGPVVSCASRGRMHVVYTHVLVRTGFIKQEECGKGTAGKATAQSSLKAVDKSSKKKRTCSLFVWVTCVVYAGGAEVK